MNKSFIYDKVLKGCLNSGVSQNVARNYAMVASDSYSKGKYKGKPINLIEQSIKDAKKVDKK